jgi:hypothetical protein
VSSEVSFELHNNGHSPSLGRAFFVRSAGTFLPERIQTRHLAAICHLYSVQNLVVTNSTFEVINTAINSYLPAMAEQQISSSRNRRQLE